MGSGDRRYFLTDRVAELSSRPGRIRHIEEISLSRPRTAETRLTEELPSIKRKLRAMPKHWAEPPLLHAKSSQAGA